MVSTPASIAARNTRSLPRTLARQVTVGSWVGWNSQARCTTADEPAKAGARSSIPTSALIQRVLGGCHSGRRRATPTISSTVGSSARAAMRAVPTLPVAPVMVICMTLSFPAREGASRSAPAGAPQSALVDLAGGEVVRDVAAEALGQRVRETREDARHRAGEPHGDRG